MKIHITPYVRLQDAIDEYVLQLELDVNWKRAEDSPSGSMMSLEYASVKEEALSFLQSGKNSLAVTAYAQSMSISEIDAALLIVEKAKRQDSILINTRLVRMIYGQKIKECTSIREANAKLVEAQGIIASIFSTTSHGIDYEKAMRREAIKAARAQQEFGGFEWRGYRFDSDQLSQQRIGNACLEAIFTKGIGGAFAKNWTLQNNTVVTLSESEMLEVGMAMGAHISLAHEKSRLKQALIEAAVTFEEVASVSW